MKRRTAVIKPFITKRQCANNFARSFVNQAPASRPSGVKIKKIKYGGNKCTSNWMLYY